MTIYLIGFMGCGKSTIGKNLSQKMYLNFFDTDSLIQELENRTITEIFDQDGEAYFRRAEKKLIDHSDYLNDSIVACGGGLPVYNDMIHVLLNKGKVIYLKASVETLIERLRNEKENRPLIAQTEENEFKQSIEERLALREPIYNKANHIITVDNKSIEEIVEEIHLKC